MNISRLTLGSVQSNCYLVTDEESGETLVIDPGAEDARLFQAVEGLRVSRILCTHRHFDHIFGVKALAERTGAKVAIHAADACGLTDGSSALMVTVPAITPDLLLADGDALPFGKGTIQVLHTPGHTVGSVCFLFQGCLFSGDTLFRGTYGRVDFPTGSAEQMHVSLLRLCELPDDTRMLPGHGAETTIAAERGWIRAH